MKKPTTTKTLIVALATSLALASTACVPLYSLDSAPCPCGPGYECCTDDNLCVPTGQCMVCPPVAELPPELFQKTVCDCNEWLPMCVGATWNYRQIQRKVTDDGAVICPDVPAKGVSIVDYRDPANPHYGKSGFNAFHLCRASDDKIKYSWVTTDDHHNDIWQFDLWFDSQKKWSYSKYYVPRKYRLDETHVDAGAQEDGHWYEDYAQYRLDKGKPEAEMVAVHATWTVVHWDAVRGPCDMLPIPPTFPVGELLCSHRDSNLEENYFCFAKGVGKIYEYSFDKEEGDEKAELLLSYSVPGCN